MINVTEKPPLLTIGILSWNRLKYLRATLESAKRCIKYPNIQWIVVDNLSTEAGLREYLESKEWLDELIFMKSSHPEAMNEIIMKAKGDYLLLWPEDVQFIVEGDWIQHCIEILNYDWIGGINLTPLRRITMKKYWSVRRFFNFRAFIMDLLRNGRYFRRQKLIQSEAGYYFKSCGWMTDGIIGAGIVSLAKTSLWKELGLWSAPGSASIVDSSGGGETYMLKKYLDSELVLHKVQSVLPFAADIIDDPIGTKAKVRGNRRYGLYNDPHDGAYYYKIYDFKDVEHLWRQRDPISVEDFVKPIGYSLPVDSKGNALKVGLNTQIISEIV